ncbi:hypothetical protein SLS53_004529 [Cytospora paraplurivora]|uniref:Cytochrome P450 n=1 Tax=Cytospora paraplurivora TaxID=2898453 RepID=A0AAN9U7Z8_9PEZI
MKRPIASIYSMSTLVEFEPYVDTTIDFFLKRLEAQSQITEPCDLGKWLQWFAFDVMGEITFSKRLGFLDKAEDVDGIMAQIFSMFRYAAWAGQIPWVERLWAKNAWVRALLPEETTPVVSFALARAKERTSIETEKVVLSDYNSKDFMSRFLEIKKKDPSIPDWFVTAWTTSNMLAGSDTTAILLRAIILFLLENPSSMGKLLEELDKAREEGRLSRIVTWKQSRELTYFDACVKEAERLYSAIGFCLERVVPQGGTQICGQYFAEGTIVGMNPWVIHRDKAIFGPDADVWNPERWLGGDEVQRRKMQNCLLTFGGGSRTCLGKNISYLEIYKLVPTLISRFQGPSAPANLNILWESVVK